MGICVSANLVDISSGNEWVYNGDDQWHLLQCPPWGGHRESVWKRKRLEYWGPLVLSRARSLHHLWSNTVLRAIPDFLFDPLSHYDSYLPGRSLGVKGHLSPWAGQQHVDSLVGLFPKFSTWWVLPSSFPFRELRRFLGVVRLIHYLFLY